MHFKTHRPWENFPAFYANQCEGELKRKRLFVASKKTKKWADKFVKCMEHYKVILKFKKEIILEPFDPRASVEERRYFYNSYRSYVAKFAREIDARNPEEHFFMA